ncbi:MAG: four helix bundle protein [Acidobacteria bacterium]|nr:four helix bundle protein [Acidobacteriota bacterium]
MPKPWDLRERTMDFAVATFRLCRNIPQTDESRDIIRQLRRSASSVASNYRATRRSQSDAVFVAKAAVVVEEADETGFWLEFLVEIGVMERPITAALRAEASELVAIFTASRKTVSARLEAERTSRRRR